MLNFGYLSFGQSILTWAISQDPRLFFEAKRGLRKKGVGERCIVAL
jgi:hypothetical protein